MKIIKKILTITMVFTMAMGFVACGKSNKLVMATEAGFAPYEYMEGQDYAGIDVDIAKAIAKDLGVELEIQDMDFTNALLAAQNGKASFAAAGISITPERLEKMDFTIEYAKSKQVIVVKKGNDSIKSEDDMIKTKIGVQNGTTADLVYNDGTKTVKSYKKYVIAADDLKNNKIDCIVMDELPAKMLIDKNDDLEILDVELFTDKYAFAVKKGDKEMLDKLNGALQKLIDEGKIEEFTQKHMEKSL